MISRDFMMIKLQDLHFHVCAASNPAIEQDVVRQMTLRYAGVQVITG